MNFASSLGEARAKKCEDRQRGGLPVSLSGGDEHCEPESRIENAPPGSGTPTRMEGEAGAPARSAGAPASLPCLSSNNCTKGKTDKLNVLTGGHQRTAFMVAYEIESLVREFGIERIGFFTLTFKDHVTDLREAQARFRSLRAHVIVKRYQRAIGVWERHQSGRVHFHLVVVLAHDIRSGADFQAFERRDYRSANPALRAEWAFWRVICPKYRFGRHELMPVKSTGEGIARYVGKYISKHVTQRLAGDKGARVVRFIGYPPGTRRTCGRFAWNTDNGWLWRQKTARFAARHGITDLDHMKRRLGPRWAYRHQERILAERLEADIVYPSRKAADRESIRYVERDVFRDRVNRLFEEMNTKRAMLHNPRNVVETASEKPLLECSAEINPVETPSPAAVKPFEERAQAMSRFAMLPPPGTADTWNSWMDFSTHNDHDD